MLLECRSQFFLQVLYSNFMIKKIRTQNFVSETSLNFFEVLHRAQIRGSLYETIVFRVVEQGSGNMIFGLKNEFIVVRMRSNVPNRESTWVLEADKV